jgi:hypothetical protein
MSTLEWKRSVLDRDAGCVVWHDCDGDLQAHHVVTQQHLRKRGLGDWAWDRRIGVTVCELAHRRHHSARERIRFEVLPSEVVVLVHALGLDWYLERYYAGTPIPEPEKPRSCGRARPRGWERKGGYVR